MAVGPLSLDEAAPLRRQVKQVVVTDACETEVHQLLAKRPPLAQGVAVAGEPQASTQPVGGVLYRGNTRHRIQLDGQSVELGHSMADSVDPGRRRLIKQKN